MNILAVLCVRNEAAFLLDWLAHHLACGVTHVLALSNACDDGTDAMLDRLAEVIGDPKAFRALLFGQDGNRP